MAKQKGGQNLAVDSSNDLISFLRREFSTSSGPVVANEAAVVGKPQGKRIEKASVAKRSKQDSSSKGAGRESLAFASKLSKSVEIFLDNEDEGRQAFEVDFPTDWKKEYSKKQAELLKSADEIFKKKNPSTSKGRSQGVSLSVSLANDAVVRWTAVVLLILNISIYLGLFHTKTADLVISSLQRPVAKAIEAVLRDKAEGGVTDFAATEKAPKQAVSKEAMADFIKNNSDLIKDDMAVSEEDLRGQVAGVSE